MIIFATGYHIDFPYMDSKKLIGYSKEDENKLSLYKFVVPTNYENFFFIGYIQVTLRILSTYSNNMSSVAAWCDLSYR